MRFYSAFLVLKFSHWFSALTLMLVFARPNHPVDAPAWILPSPLPLPPRKARPVTPPAASKKRNAPDDDEIVEVEPSSKRAKINGPSAPALTSPSKKRRLEEDGLLLMDNANDQLRDDVIEID